MNGVSFARLIGQPPPRFRDLVATAERADTVLLPQIEPVWIGNALAVLGLVAGVLWARVHTPGAGTVLGWVAMAAILVGMSIQMSRRRVDTGWLVDLQRRVVSPVGRPGEPVAIAGEGYSVVFGAGEKKRTVVIDLCRAEHGRVVRLFETPGSVRLADHRALSALADVLARRLRVGRDGLTF